MKTRIFRRSILVPVLMAPLTLGLAACGSSDDSERRAAADYLQNRGEALEDSAITSKVAAAITEERSLSGSEIRVKTYNNIVHLTGYVASRNDARMAEDLAYDVRGVREVDNDLLVR